MSKYSTIHEKRKQFALQTGLRISEILKLKPENIDFEEIQIFMNGKGGRSRYIDIKPEWKQFLKQELDNMAKN